MNTNKKSRALEYKTNLHCLSRIVFFFSFELFVVCNITNNFSLFFYIYIAVYKWPSFCFLLSLVNDKLYYLRLHDVVICFQFFSFLSFFYAIYIYIYYYAGFLFAFCICMFFCLELFRINIVYVSYFFFFSLFIILKFTKKSISLNASMYLCNAGCFFFFLSLLCHILRDEILFFFF